MPQAVPVAIRREIVARHRAGESLPAIARDLGLSPWTVRTLWRRVRDRGEAGLAPAYDRCGRPGPRGAPRIHRAACWLRRRHPGWGARLILSILGERYPDEPLPIRARWSAGSGRAACSPRPRRRGRRPRPAPPRRTRSGRWMPRNRCAWRMGRGRVG